MAKQVDTYIPKSDNKFYLYLGSKRYFLFMSLPPFKFTPNYNQIKLLKNNNHANKD